MSENGNGVASYEAFLYRKSQLGGDAGFAPVWMPDFLFDFQRALVEWSLRKGRGAIFADCGVGKTPMALTWAENVVRQTNRSVLITTPLAVGYQFVREGEKFGIECKRLADGSQLSGVGIYVTNYERLHLFNPSNFIGMVADESSILKNMDGVRRAEVTEFMRKLAYRLLGTATAAPNDYIELGTSSEALGELGHMDMLTRFFKNEQSTVSPVRRWNEGGKWRFKRHAEQPFWRWVCSWARALRKPSDLGFSDDAFRLPPLEQQEHIVSARSKRDGWLFDMPAIGLTEEREERRRTLQERCEKVAELVAHKHQALVWCHLNPEGDLLARMIPDAQQVSGADRDDVKEERLLAFADGKLRVLITKPKIGAWGLNLQNCAHVVTFASHSYEQMYQSIRRCWRFGQTRPVRVDIVATEGERAVLNNLARKAQQATRMFESLVAHMNEAQNISRSSECVEREEIPAWL